MYRNNSFATRVIYDKRPIAPGAPVLFSIRIYLRFHCRNYLLLHAGIMGSVCLELHTYTRGQVLLMFNEPISNLQCITPQEPTDKLNSI